MNKTIGLLDFLSKSSTTMPEETVHVDLWGRAVTLRGFTSRERDLWEEDCLRLNRAKGSNGRRPGRNESIDPDLTNFRARLVARSIVEDGVRTCWNDRGEELLGNQPATVIDPLFAAAQRLHGMSDADVEAMAGNLGETEDAASSSVSPSPTDAPLPN
jgi:hypothetical protein